MIIKKSEQIIDEVRKVIVGKDDVIRKVLMAMYADGHILLEDAPGVGKTTLALAFSGALGLDYRRVQFTPDTMPSDITGFSMFNKLTNEFEYKPGAVNCNMMLGDEINRTSARTQAALLEVMEERSVTVDGVAHSVPKPFVVIATQNPLGSAGTQPLPASQLDRFTVCLSIGYPSTELQMQMMRDRMKENPLENVQAVASKDDILMIQEYLGSIRMTDDIMRYITLLCEATRTNPYVELGVSPRGALVLSRMARACAVLSERDFVTPEDVREVVVDTCAHRLVMRPQARIEGVSPADVLNEVLDRVTPPGMGPKHGAYQ